MARKKAASGPVQSGRAETTKHRPKPTRSAAKQTKRPRADEASQTTKRSAKRATRAAAKPTDELDAVVRVHRNAAGKHDTSLKKTLPAFIADDSLAPAGATKEITPQTTQQTINAGQGWEVMLPATLSKVFNEANLTKKGRIAAFNLDASLVTMHVDDDDSIKFTWFNNNVIDKLRDVPTEGFTLAFFCGRGVDGGALSASRAHDGPRLLDALLGELAVPAVVCLSAADDEGRMPHAGAWQCTLRALHMDESEIDSHGSFLVGAESGQQGETGASTDQALASSLGLEFCSVEEYFGPPKMEINHNADSVQGSPDEPNVAQGEQDVEIKSSVEQAEQSVEEAAEEAKRLSAAPPEAPASQPGKPVYLEKADEDNVAADDATQGLTHAAGELEAARAPTWWPY